MTAAIEYRPGKRPRAVIDGKYVVVIDGRDVYETRRRLSAEAFVAGYKFAQKVAA